MVFPSLSMHATPHLVSLLLAAAAALVSPAAAQGRHIFDIDSPNSTTTFGGNVTLSGVTGNIIGNPSTFSTSGAADIDLTITAGALTAGRFVRGDSVVTIPTLNAFVPNPIPFLPPLANVTVTGMTVVFRSVDPVTFAPQTFPIAGDGSFSANVVADILTGTADVEVFGQPPEQILLAGSASDPNIFTGSILSTADGFELVSNYNSTFAFSDPGTGATGNLTISGSLVATDRGMAGDTLTISIPVGGTQVLTHSAGTAQATKIYAVLGSISGTAPGTVSNGVLIPLNFDAWTNGTVSFANGPILGTSIGFLDVLGTGTTTITFPALSPSLIGLAFDHAYIVINPTTFLVEAASNAVPLTFVP